MQLQAWKSREHTVAYWREPCGQAARSRAAAVRTVGHLLAAAALLAHLMPCSAALRAAAAPVTSKWFARLAVAPQHASPRKPRRAASCQSKPLLRRRTHTRTVLPHERQWDSPFVHSLCRPVPQQASFQGTAAQSSKPCPRAAAPDCELPGLHARPDCCTGWPRAQQLHVAP